MWRWLGKIFYFRSKVAGKRVYFDTNCYRQIEPTNDIEKTKALVKKMRRKEWWRGVDVGLSYLVASEMFVHLGDDPTKRYYRESKNGLIAAIEHIGKKKKRMLPGPDSEMHKVIFGTLPKEEKESQQSLMDVLLFLDTHSFNDAEIAKHKSQYQATDQFLQKTKDTWVDSFMNAFIIKHDPTFTGGWQVFAQDKVERNKLLNKLIAGERSGDIFREFALGVCVYTVNGTNVKNPKITEAVLKKVLTRFKPVFQLQLRILKFICQNGYNLAEKRQNDILDYLVMVSFNPKNTLFVSNETNSLVPILHELGYKGQVMTLNDYLEAIKVKR